MKAWNTLYFVGYHDLFRINLDNLKNLPCFAPGNAYLVEVPLTEASADIFMEAECRNDLECKLHNKLGLNEIVSANIADLWELWDGKSWIIPCATKSSGEIRDIEITVLASTALNIIEGNCTFYGGTLHAENMCNKINFQNKILYDFRYEQARHNKELLNIMTAEARNNKDLLTRMRVEGLMA